MATVLARAFRLTGTAPLNFKDTQQIAAWAIQGVKAVQATGYLPGFGDGTFKPKDPVTRDQAASALESAIVNRQLPQFQRAANVRQWARSKRKPRSTSVVAVLWIPSSNRVPEH